MTVKRAQPRPPPTSLPMTTKQIDQHDRIERDTQETTCALIGEQVIHTLGQPASLLKVSVRPLWANVYRVNVFVGSDAVSARIANSFFLTVDGHGKIAVSTPKITRQY
jgi:hypothetical protein